MFEQVKQRLLRPLTNPEIQPKKPFIVKYVILVTFSHNNDVFVGWDCYPVGNRLRETQPTQILRKHPVM